MLLEALEVLSLEGHRQQPHGNEGLSFEPSGAPTNRGSLFSPMNLLARKAGLISSSPQSQARRAFCDAPPSSSHPRESLDPSTG